MTTDRIPMDDPIPADPEKQARLITRAILDSARWLRDIADALRDIHAALETIARNNK